LGNDAPRGVFLELICDLCVTLDRKLERVLAMLLRLKELRGSIEPG
jgi:hypothetical protein